MSEIKIGFNYYKENLEKLTKELTNIKEIEISAIALFGSVVRNEANFNSDIDLIIVYEGEREKLSRYFRQIKEKFPDEHFASRLYPIFLTKKKMWEHPHILLDVLDHGIILYDTGVLKTRLEALSKKLKQLGAKKVVLENNKWYWDLKPDWKPGEIFDLGEPMKDE